MKLADINDLDKISDEFETGSYGVKRRSLGKIIASCVLRRQQFALKAYPSYNPGPTDSKLDWSHRSGL